MSAPGDLLEGRPRLLAALLLVLFLVAGAVRCIRLDAPGVLVDRDFTSAMFSRDFYFRHAAGIEPWRRDVARATRANQPTLEPPVTEWLVAQAYRLAGGEDLRLARLLTTLFWLGGGLFLFRTARVLVATDAALFALAYYLFLPMSVLLSRSFQPDALMMLLFLAGLHGIVRYQERPTGPRLALAALVGAAALVYRPLVLPALCAAFVAPEVQRRGPWRGIVCRPSLSYLAGAAGPALLYYGYASFVARYFGWKLASSFRFDLWPHREYWRGWFDLALSSIGVPALLCAVVGFAMLRRGVPRAIVTGLALGYVAFGLLFTMHIHTHNYYHAQLIPLVGLAASPAVAWIARRVVEHRVPWQRWAVAALVVGLVALGWGREVRRGLARAGFEPPEVAREIGRLVGHSTHVVYLSRYYGLPLQYLGEFTGAYWPRPITYWLYRATGEHELSIAQRLERIPFEPDYFVITAFAEYERHHQDLAAYLERACAAKAVTADYRVYERCAPPASSGVDFPER